MSPKSVRRHHPPSVAVIGWRVRGCAHDGAVRTRPIMVVIVAYGAAAPNGVLCCRDATAHFTIALRCGIANFIPRFPAGHHIDVVAVNNARTLLRRAVGSLLR